MFIGDKRVDSKLLMNYTHIDDFPLLQIIKSHRFKDKIVN